MYKSHLWQKEYEDSRKNLFNEQLSVARKENDENDKTKTDLIREFCDYKGDKWKYLSTHPRTRMALCTSGDATWNSVDNTTPFVSALFGQTLNPLRFASVTTLNANSANFLSSVQPIALPLQFGITIVGSGGNYSIFHNIAFTTYPYGTILNNPNVGSGIFGANGNPFSVNAGYGFSLRVLTTGTSGCTYSQWGYASTGLSVGAIAAQTETAIPGFSASVNAYLNGATVFYFRLYASGDKIGFSQNGTSWTYWTPPTPYYTKGLYLVLGCSQIVSSATFFTSSMAYSLFNVPGTLANLP